MSTKIYFTEADDVWSLTDSTAGIMREAVQENLDTFFNQLTCVYKRSKNFMAPLIESPIYHSINVFSKIRIRTKKDQS